MRPTATAKISLPWLVHAAAGLASCAVMAVIFLGVDGFVSVWQRFWEPEQLPVMVYTDADFMRAPPVPGQAPVGAADGSSSPTPAAAPSPPQDVRTGTLPRRQASEQ